MPKIKQAVTTKAAEAFSKKDGVHAIGHPPGLYLSVRGPSRLWILRYSSGNQLSNGEKTRGQIVPRRRALSLGSYDDYTLEEARELARDARKKIREGIDPIEEREAARQTAVVVKAKRFTFGECADRYIAAHEAGWKNPKHGQQWRNTLDTYAKPILGKLPVEAVDTGLVMQVLEPIWATKPETASRLRGRIEAVLDWATVQEYRQGVNPARWKGHLDKLLPAKGKIKKVEHHAALPYAEVGDFMVALAKMEGMGARALEFAILTAVRSGEVRGATWAEIDLDAALWVIPAERMKGKKNETREHRVPLSDAAVALLKALPRFEDQDLVFPGAKGQLSDMTLTAALKRMGRGDLTAHGFRSAFRDWASEVTNYPREVAEMALAHTIGSKVEAAYRRGDLFEKRRRLMADWARYCATPSAKGEKVTPIRAAV